MYILAFFVQLMTILTQFVAIVMLIKPPFDSKGQVIRINLEMKFLTRWISKTDLADQIRTYAVHHWSPMFSNEKLISIILEFYSRVANAIP
jgi:hypothetical protein